MRKSLVVKLFLIIISITLLCGVLPGCDETDDDSFMTNTGNSDKQQGLEPVSLNFCFIGSPKPDSRKVLDEIERRTAGILNAKLNFKWVRLSGDLLNGVAGGKDIDAFQCLGTSPFGLLHVLQARSGELKDITSLLPMYAPELTKMYTEDELKSARIDDKLYILPALYPYSYNIYTVVREDLKVKYNIPDIKTLDDYHTYLKTIKENHPGIIPGKISSTTEEILPYCFNYIVLDADEALVYRIDDPEMKVMPLEHIPEMDLYLRYVTEWNETGYLQLLKTPNVLKNYSYMWDETYDAITSGVISSFIINESRIGCSIESMISELNTVLKNSSEDAGAELKAYPLYPDNIKLRVNPAESQHDSRALAFSAKSDNVERALMFLNWVYSNQENYDLLMYGLEDVHYVKYDDTFRLPQGTSMKQNRYIGWDGSMALSNILYERFLTARPKEDKEAYIEKMADYTMFVPHLGFYANYLGNYIDEMTNDRRILFEDFFSKALLKGKLKLGDASKFYARGTDEIVSEIQRQLDAWREQKSK